jgi:hypothetical protein
MKPNDTESFCLILRPLQTGEQPPPIVRLRRLLKRLLRAYGLRCVRVEPIRTRSRKAVTPNEHDTCNK